MNFVLIGVNHKTAPVEVRERLALTESRLPEANQRLARVSGLNEAMILSTCNRVELIAHAQNGNGANQLRSFVRDYFKLEPAEIDSHLYEYREQEAVRHLFRVASSLDSMIVGEPQILGQVKDAYTVARGVGSVQSRLDALLTRAFAVAKRVRNETAIGTSAVSVASVAVELAKKIFGTLAGKKVFIVGAGKMSELAARHLLAHGAGSIFVANRTYDRAVELAHRFHGEAIRFIDIYDTADQADIVITSTGAPHAIFRREHGEKFLARRRNNPMFFIDIAVPRDCDAALNDLEGIFVYDIDDLQQVVAAHSEDRKREAARAEAIINTEVERFSERIATLKVAPTIVSLTEQIEIIRQGEIDRVRGRLGKLTPEQELAVEALTKGIVNKVLHAPITTLKTAAKDPESTTVIELIRRIFNLDTESKKAGSGE